MRVLLVGCGQMGSWFARRLAARGHSLLLHDSRSEAAAELSRELGCEVVGEVFEAARRADLVLLAVPIREAKRLMRSLARSEPGFRSLMDVSALKGPLVGPAGLLRSKGVIVALAHPLFGPRTESTEGTYTAHVEPIDADREEELIRALIPGTKLIRMNWRDHDRAVAVSVSLTHYVGLALADALSGSPAVLPTNSVRLAKELAEVALNESSSFYEDFVMTSGSARAALRRYIRACERLLRASEVGRLGLVHGRLKGATKVRGPPDGT
ncbi:MAG: prephenate dehydrogenase/arogenate dehydrogenase family protein [Candidatus Caldarchaeales archaeon]